MLAVGIIGCLLGFVLVIFLSYKNFSPFIASVIGALFVIIVTGSPLAETLTGVYFPKLASFVSGYWGIFLFGSILAKIYADSGAALSIAEGIMRLLVREGSSEKTKQIMALVVSMLMTGVLGLGGIITSVAVIIAYPLSLAVLEQANIPKRFSFAALALGAYTWCCVMPGSPQVTNIIPSNYLGTTGMALLVPGIIGVIVWVVLALAVLNLMVSKAKKNGEGFAYGATDTKYDTSEAKPNVWIAADVSELIFENCRVPKTNLLGKEGKGFKIFMEALDGGRIGMASQALGIAEEALKLSKDYLKVRVQFGKPLEKQQGLQWYIADMATKVSAARALIYEAAMTMDRGENCTEIAAIAKYYASEMAVEVTNKALQIYSGYGYMRDYPLERMYRDARIVPIYEGTSEIQKNIIAREELK